MGRVTNIIDQPCFYRSFRVISGNDKLVFEVHTVNATVSIFFSGHVMNRMIFVKYMIHSGNDTPSGVNKGSAIH
jgi:hypothetical protein